MTQLNKMVVFNENYEHFKPTVNGVSALNRISMILFFVGRIEKLDRMTSFKKFQFKTPLPLIACE